MTQEKRIKLYEQYGEAGRNKFILNKFLGGNKMEEENQTEVGDWRKEVSSSLNPKLKIQDGETKTITFMDEGSNYKHPDYKPCIIFTVKLEGNEEELTWYVNKEAYGVLNQIKALGKLTGLKVTVSRTGSRKSDTRYKINKV